MQLNTVGKFCTNSTVFRILWHQTRPLNYLGIVKLKQPITLHGTKSSALPRMGNDDKVELRYVGVQWQVILPTSGNCAVARHPHTSKATNVLWRVGSGDFVVNPEYRRYARSSVCETNVSKRQIWWRFARLQLCVARTKTHLFSWTSTDGGGAVDR